MGDLNFKQLGLNDTLLSVVEKLYFKAPTAIQQQAIPQILNGKSIIGESQTGSGKTHAYLLPLLHQIDETKNEVQMVITAPTRELAMQLLEEIRTITTLAGKEDNWKSRLIVGGLDRQRMKKQLANSTHIVFGTPGRILYMFYEDVLSIYTAHSFVFDVSIFMLDFHFIISIHYLLVIHI